MSAKGTLRREVEGILDDFHRTAYRVGYDRALRDAAQKIIDLVDDVADDARESAERSEM